MEMVCDELSKEMRCPFTEIVRKSRPSATKLVMLFRGHLMCTKNHADKLLTSFGIEVLNTLSYTGNTSLCTRCTKISCYFHFLLTYVHNYKSYITC